MSKTICGKVAAGLQAPSRHRRREDIRIADGPRADPIPYFGDNSNRTDPGRVRPTWHDGPIETVAGGKRGMAFKA